MKKNQDVYDNFMSNMNEQLTKINDDRTKFMESLAETISAINAATDEMNKKDDQKLALQYDVRREVQEAPVQDDVRREVQELRDEIRYLRQRVRDLENSINEAWWNAGWNAGWDAAGWD